MRPINLIKNNCKRTFDHDDTVLFEIHLKLKENERLLTKLTFIVSLFKLTCHPSNCDYWSFRISYSNAVNYIVWSVDSFSERLISHHA